MSILKKTRQCRVCKVEFTPVRCLQNVCSPACAQKAAEISRAKKERQRQKDERRMIKESLEKLKPLSYWADRAQKAVNAFIRARDEGQPCISCGKPATWDGQWHASHFRSVGAASAVRFNLWNIHKSCSVCNNWKSGNLSEYEPMLRKKIGDEKVDWLRTQTQTRKYSIEYLKRIKTIFEIKTKRIKAKRDMM